MVARTRSHPLTRAARASAFAALVAGVTACSAPIANDPGSLTIGIVGDVGPLDPALNPGLGAFDAAAETMETLVRLRPGSSDVVPGLAQSWSVAPDGLTWTFTLRPGASFSDGSPADAVAVKANFDRWRISNDSRHWDHEYPTYVARFGGYDAQSIVDNVSVLTPAQVVIHTRTPFGPLLRDLTIPAFSIGSPNAMSNDRQLYEEVPTGSGPYLVTDLRDGDHATLERNPHANGTPAPVAEITLRAIPDPATAQLVLEKDDVDAVVNPPPDVVRGMAGRTDMRSVRWPSNATCFLAFTSDKPPFDSASLRLAVAKAVNRAKLATEFDDPTLVPAATWIPPGMLGFDPGAQATPYDPAGAKALVAGSHVAGTSITLDYPSSPTPLLPDPGAVAQSIVADLSAAGFAVSAVPVDVAPSQPSDAAGNLALGVVFSDSGDPSDLFAPLLSTWHDVGFSAIAAHGAATVADATRAGIYRNLDAFVRANTGAVPLVHPARSAGFSTLATVSLDSPLLPPPVSK